MKEEISDSDSSNVSKVILEIRRRIWRWASL